MVHGRFEMAAGVPVHGEGVGGVEDVQTRWNRALLEELFGGGGGNGGNGGGGVMVQMLLRLKDLYSHTPNEFYRHWPTMRGNCPSGATTSETTSGTTSGTTSNQSPQMLMDRISAVTLFQTLANLKLYWSNTAQTWNTLAGGLLPNAKCTCLVYLSICVDTCFSVLTPVDLCLQSVDLCLHLLICVYTC